MKFSNFCRIQGEIVAHTDSFASFLLSSRLWDVFVHTNRVVSAQFLILFQHVARPIWRNLILYVDSLGIAAVFRIH